ncbi:unnamed protein product [Cuscuta campestris]|uniref:Uncharacterized protein n=2 Tax=Cuscuta sect. Cleistogrammica TaxID=1824901 RepID=A0A484K5X2_9ASTE|nr:hypothetical protein DM860_003811 [Cuscuta australis]VFQ59154.1 unnamed protein product [Cuscuta campestris]
MVIALGPGRFYGKSLPRPRIYEDVKFNDHRVDPPVPVSDPLMSWAEEAHWSMGGLSLTRHRLQGKIEGNLNKIRAEEERQDRKILKKSSSPVFSTPSPPPAPIATKRKRRFIDEAEDGSFPARKLGDDFDRVAQEVEAKEKVGVQTRGRKAEKVAVEAVVVAKEKPQGFKRLKKGIKSAKETGPASPSQKRSSPRLSKRELP